jgi:hypothetical protein
MPNPRGLVSGEMHRSGNGSYGGRGCMQRGGACGGARGRERVGRERKKAMKREAERGSASRSQREREWES